MKKFYRPSPFKTHGNPFMHLLKNELLARNYYASDFKFWKIIELIKYRNKVKVIHLHWPESLWRSQYRILTLLKVIHFLIILKVSKVLGYKWVMSAHNVTPHYKVLMPKVEYRMRQYIIREFDGIVGHAFNTKQDLKLAYGSSGKKYMLALHGIYNNYYPITIDRRNLREQYGIDPDAKIILSINAYHRENRGADEITKTWSHLSDKNNVNLLITGNTPNNHQELMNDGHYHHIKGRVPDQEIGNILNAVDYLLLNYKNITTSGMYFLALTFRLPIIAPDIPFFQLHSLPQTILQYDSSLPLDEELQKILNKINKGWVADMDQIETLRNTYQWSGSAQNIMLLYDEICGY